MTVKQDNTSRGHRERMRTKYKEHGARFFETYELLEMALYHVLPYVDTKPIAKLLLEKFGTVNAVFCASHEELTKVPGVGDRVADFIIDLGTLTGSKSACIKGEKQFVFDDYDRAGDFFVDYFDKNQDTNIVMLLLDNCMRMLGIESIPGVNYGSGAVLPKYFIAAAFKHHATAAIVAYTHRSSVAYPYSGDYETSRMVRFELANVGVTLLEEYVIGGGDYRGSPTDIHFSMPPSDAMLRFLRGREEKNG